MRIDWRTVVVNKEVSIAIGGLLKLCSDCRTIVYKSALLNLKPFKTYYGQWDIRMNC